MTWPAPPPAPQPGGPHPREWVGLVRYARACGFERVHQSVTGRTSVWSDGVWRVEVDMLRSVAEVRVLRRSDTRFECWDERVVLFHAGPAELFGALIAVGVLPSPIGEAA